MEVVLILNPPASALTNLGEKGFFHQILEIYLQASTAVKAANYT